MHTTHRPWPLPDGKYSWYQEWRRLIFLHFKLAYGEIEQLLPEGIKPDMFNDSAWVSIVPFSMQNIRPRLLPAFAPVSHFDEINVRTYVTDGKHPGVFFLNIEAGNKIAVQLAKTLSGLPYEKSEMNRSFGPVCGYRSKNTMKKFKLDMEYSIGKDVAVPSPLDIWLTERYRLYLAVNKRTYSYDIHHLPWPLREITFKSLKLDYSLNGLNLNQAGLVKANYSDGVKVVAWGRDPFIK